HSFPTRRSSDLIPDSTSQDDQRSCSWGRDSTVTLTEDLLAATGADVRFEGREAWYFYPPQDYILCPPQHLYLDYPAFASTVFHELGHWTEPRLSWRGSEAV